ncbi:MAG: hypothetical protein D1H97_19500 [Paracoccus sp. BP8]|uniref:amidohydrolase family protein n=1 Tax=Paracoccus sp. J39 TaxID=935848 RepID=UPI00048C2A40|nr:amidohydrolase family protein [Paracoccus sp. J39]RQP04156.1 MAG: hypothetical protein D1H97_19500 [Paracoccus sp. BP8]
MAQQGEKRLHGREEEIVDPDLPIIDSHHHLFDFPHYRYMLDDYLEDARAGHNIVATVYAEIQAFARKSGPEALRPLGEVEFANGIGAMCAGGQYGPRVAAAIVGHADLRHGAAIGAYLDRAMAAAPDRFRGVRQVTIEHPDEIIHRYITHRPPTGVLAHPGFRAGVTELARRGLSFDAAVFHNQLGDIAELARAFPDMPIVLDHLGLAMGLGKDESGMTEVFAEWRAALRALAECGNVTCKIGGFGLPFWGFGLHDSPGPDASTRLAAIWAPYIETAVEAFGADRCMMESNYPPDSRSCGFVPLWNALKRVTLGCSAEEKQALYSGTARRVYRIELPE